MKDWMDARLGNSMSTAYSALRSKGIPEQTLERIPERNAYHLTRLPETERHSDTWVGKAATLPTKDFKEEVERELEKKTRFQKEEIRTFSVALPKPVYESLCAAEEKIARALTIDIETKPGSRIRLGSSRSMDPADRRGDDQSPDGRSLKNCRGMHEAGAAVQVR
jgi:hypothetical protein